MAIKIWKLECSHSGDAVYVWNYFKNKPSVQTLLAEFKDYTKTPPEEKELEELINRGYSKIKYSEFYLEEVEVIENDMGF